MLRERKRTGWIGVDVGTRSVKLAQVESVGSDLRLLHGVVVPRSHPWPAFEDPLESSPRSSQAEIHAGMLLVEELSGRFAACVLPMSVQGFRAMHIPEGSFEQRRNMIAGELDELQDLDEWQFDYWDTDVLNHDKAQATDNVSVLLVARSWTNQIAHDTARTKLICKAIDGVPLTLARTLEMSSPDASQTPVAALDWGYRSTTLSIVADGAPIYTRGLRDCHVGRLVEAIMQSLGTTVVEAEKLLIHGGRLGNQDRISAFETIILSVVNELADELNKTFRYLRSQRPELAPERVWMYGGGSTIQTAAETLTQQTGLSVQRWPGPTNDHSENTAHACPPALLASAMSLSALAFRN